MYKEINPAVFAMVSFPFLFGVMYGDMGHGGIYLIIGILLVMFDSRIRKVPGIGAIVSSIRYLILLMGIFAVYNGFIYNEFFAISIDFFGSCYSKDVSVLSAGAP
jgi:V-type H+-transporting ATPase subunit a